MPGIANNEDRRRELTEATMLGGAEACSRVAGRGLEGAGLSKRHISSNRKYPLTNDNYRPTFFSVDTAQLRINSDANLIEVRVNNKWLRSEYTPSESTPARGRVTEWSKKARMRAKRRMAQVRIDALKDAVTVTLTYPSEFPPADDHEVYKTHLDRMNTKLRKMGLCGFWKLEFQKRGAPHYHLLLIPEQKWDLKLLRKLIAEKWYKTVGSNDPKHLQAGTEVSPVKSPKGAMGYLCSYMGKKEQTMPGNFTGHYFGSIARAKIPFGKLKDIPVSNKVANKIRRVARKGIQVSMRSYFYKGVMAQLKTGPLSDLTREELDNALSRLGAKNRTKRQELIIDTFQRWDLKLPHKYRLRNTQCTRWIIDANNFEQCMIRYFAPVKRSLANHGFLP